MFYYVPSTTQAYDRMLDLRGTVAFGTFLRNMHRWSAHGMVAIVFLHMCRVFFTGSYKTPREFNWVVGVALFLLTLFLSFTGYLLPWDQLAFWAITVGTSIAGYAPVVGQDIKFLLLGDATVGQEALLRFYVLHVAVLPAILTLLIAIHFWRIRKDGGLSRPAEADLPETVAARAAHRHYRQGQGADAEQALRPAGLRSRTLHQTRQRPRQQRLHLAEPDDRRALRLRPHPGRSSSASRCSSTRRSNSPST